MLLLLLLRRRSPRSPWDSQGLQVARRASRRSRSTKGGRDGGGVPPLTPAPGRDITTTAMRRVVAFSCYELLHVKLRG